MSPLVSAFPDSLPKLKGVKWVKWVKGVKGVKGVQGVQVAGMITGEPFNPATQLHLQRLLLLLAARTAESFTGYSSTTNITSF